MLQAQAIPHRVLEAFPAKEAGHEIMKVFACRDYAGRQLAVKKDCGRFCHFVQHPLDEMRYKQQTMMI
ncbi:MAG TPA: hypothetical protein OIM03_02075 [Veillonellaceae bacterium]|nr:hypothetical protein [Veillonellaceae bacterium]